MPRLQGTRAERRLLKALGGLCAAEGFSWANIAMECDPSLTPRGTAAAWIEILLHEVCHRSWDCGGLGTAKPQRGSYPGDMSELATLAMEIELMQNLNVAVPTDLVRSAALLWKTLQGSAGYERRCDVIAMFRQDPVLLQHAVGIYDTLKLHGEAPRSVWIDNFENCVLDRIAAEQAEEELSAANDDS